MGHLRTLLRKNYANCPPTKKNRERRGHEISDKPGVSFRRSTPEMKGTKAFLLSIGVPPRILKGRDDGVKLEARYHFTKGWRVATAH